MEKIKLSELTDEQLMQEAKKMKSAAIMNAVLIGFLAGVILYSILKNTIGFLTIVPLFIAYKFIKQSNYNKQELESVLKERNLK